MSFTRIKGIIFQNLYHLKHSLEDGVDTFFWPTMDIVIWGLMTNYFTTLRGSIVNIIAFLLSGLILWNIVWRAQQDVSFSFLRNIWNRNLVNLFSSPLSPWEFVIAAMFLGLIKIILTLTIISLIAFFLYSFNIFSLGFSLLPFFVSLIFFAWAAGLFITGLIVRYGMRIQAFTWSLIVLINPLSAVFYPVSVLPPFVQKIAWMLPTTHIFEGMRQILGKNQLPIEHLVWAFILNAIYLFLAGWFFTFMFKKARQKGSLAKIEM